MKFTDFEDTILDSGELMKKAGHAIIYNMGKIIALFVALLMLAVTFTDVTFTGIFTKNFASSLLLLITSSYIIYFSLEDAGEKCGIETSEYIFTKDKYDKIRAEISGDRISSLRSFCIEYSKNELEFRKNCALTSHGLTQKDLFDFLSGKRFDKKTNRSLHNISKIKSVSITPKTLLQRERWHGRSELENPEKRKIPMLLIKLIPSTVCMAVTVSVMLTAKDGLTGADVLNGILKLSALPMIGFKGYSAGYSYAKHTLSLWNETKANILLSFKKSLTDNEVEEHINY